MQRPLPADLRPLHVRRHELLPIVQGGMGVGVSAHRLASAVAREGALGTIASVDLRHHHADLMAQCKDVRDRTVLDRLNLIALDREIRLAHEQADGRGAIAVNVMKAVDQHAALVRQSCESGADAIVMGAGLPLDLPDQCADFPEVALIPILSDARGVAIVLRRWMRKKRLPDAIVIEHPRYAGGHLGATRIEELNDTRFDFENVIEGVSVALRDLQIEREAIPLIAAGGIATPERMREVLALGYAAVQVGTPFAVTEEGDAHPNFKKVLAGARREDIVEFISVAGLPARAVRTVWLRALPAARVRAQGRGNRVDGEEVAAGPRGPMQRGAAVPDDVRTARWHREHRPVLHRHPARCGAARRTLARTVLPRRRSGAVRYGDPTGARIDRLLPDWSHARGP